MTVRFRSTFEEERVVPWLGDIVVEPGGVITVPDEEWESWVAGGWEPLDPDPSKAAAPTVPPASPSPGSNAPAPAAPPAPPVTPSPAQPTPAVQAASDPKGN